ncbi:arsenate reductase (glutaredoxin) [Acetobacter sp. LMG 1636]|uniref:Arsenate reductase n=2 Tax=Acetobacter fallax TaxID=1737473 RepID=A0ABX0K5U1_9PROT|nr:arsenate reductase (glutaredoxin) [Acetobacter fallax]NHO35308.1 arsenate reductase (glutaredoxin) [Acetobacter fallax]
MQATIFHNPRCGTSRRVLERLTQAGLEVWIVEYLRTPPDRATLAEIARAGGIGVRGLLRAKETLVAEPGLDAPDISDDALLDAMVAHPVLINRPVVVTERGTRLCRPAELVEDLLPPAA